jgi:hypothetical protein
VYVELYIPSQYSHSFSVLDTTLPLYGSFLLLPLRRVPCSTQNIHFLRKTLNDTSNFLVFMCGVIGDSLTELGLGIGSPRGREP